MRSRIITAAVLLACAPALGAQEAPKLPNLWTLEFRPVVGAYVPVGRMRDDFEAATTLGMQTALELSSRWHVVGGISWAHGHSKLPLASERTNIWQYDLGAEASLLPAIGERWVLRSFLGIGAGGRTYDYRARGDGTKSCVAGYASLGSELQHGAVALRLEARDYLSCFDSPRTGSRSTRNDLGLSVGVSYHVQ